MQTRTRGARRQTWRHRGLYHEELRFYGRPTDGVSYRNRFGGQRRRHLSRFCFDCDCVSLFVFSLFVCLHAYHIVNTVFVVMLFHYFRPSLIIALLCTLVGWLSSWAVLFFMSCCRHHSPSFSRIQPRLCPCTGTFLPPPPFVVFLHTGAGVGVIWDWWPSR